MFVRSYWKPRSPEEAYALIREHPWALLASNGSDGPLATNLPLLLDRTRGPHGVLVGHMARANPHLTALEQAAEPSLAIFHGPAAYVTPAWYPDRDMPGTYYYMSVHCSGRLGFLDDDALEASLAQLNERMEDGRSDGWRLDEIPHSEITRRLPAIRGFVIEIERLQAKFKLGQDEPLKDVLAVADRLAASEHAVERQLAAAVRHANRGREDGRSG